MSTTFSVSRDDIINRALRLCGAFDPANPPGSSDFTIASLAFNMMIKEWIITIPMWKVEIITLPLLQGQNSYNIGPYATGPGALVMDKILRVQYATVRNNQVVGQPFDTPIDQLSIQEYEQYGAKQSSGIVNSMLYRPLDDNQSLGISSYILVYPTPADNTRSLRMICLTELNDVNVGTDPLDFPQECYIALSWNLASEIAFEYQTPLDRFAVIERRAEMTKQAMEDWSQENTDSIRFMYDKRSGQ